MAARWIRRLAAVACAAFALLAGGTFADELPADYPPVLPGRAIEFPADTGAHPAFRTEWWYVTGWLADGEGIERGFQITFFRVRTRIGEGNPSRFAPRQLVLAHAAVADPKAGRLLHAERAARALPPLVGFETGRTHAWVGDWSIAWEGDHYLARAAGEDFAFDLRFDPTAAPMLNGEAGFSRKDADPRHASHYYSRPQLAARGTLRVDGQDREVSGRAWLDHEWSSELMPEGVRGWDWLGINLHDGGALMAFRMRDEQGEPRWAGGTLRAADGSQRSLAPQELRFTPLRRWRSSRTGADYAVTWRLELNPAGAAPRTLEIQPLMDDQELDSRRSTGAVYWEGAVRLLEGGREIGRGYLEMTGYAERLRM
ncbi:lipocalin-like domain-containing protein [Pseudothauera rhizosphaerae]|uniref:Carotenoid 1,2-hydratase n=1 Tax=Pseudothauera rhizosphaerae TaxID=2565932 RepID=A0A4S4AV81_9RHOO|nr:carotenoid 1,2-hydratase [Pseudothauera rhizosphaerae]THF63450.1 carotenoid 1,2-hydratase [Pseudothauera rhizosphaerae]